MNKPAVYCPSVQYTTRHFRHHVHIKKCGSSYRFYQNDQLAISFEDNGEHGPTLTQDHWGFRTWRAAVRLYSVKVVAL